MSSASKGLRRVGVGSLSALLAATAMTGLASTASATTDATFTRVQGADRYATSVATAKLFGTVSDVILASGEPGHTVDALSASVLAGFKDAPILLTKQAATPQSVLDQIKASGAQNIWIVGGTSAVSAAQEQALKDAGYAVARLAGADRWGTAADIINHSNKSTTALIATGLDFPDALGGGALSYAAGLPMGIVKKDSVPAATLDALKNAGVTQVIILGGEGVVSASVVSQLAAEGITVKARLGGANRAETSTLLADYEVANYGFTNTAANIASGYAFGDGADALGGSAFSGEKKTPLLITNSATKADPLVAWLTAHSNTVAGGYVFGGPGAVSDALVAQLQAAARNVTSKKVLTVTPQAALTVAQADEAGASKDADNRTYTVTGLDANTGYTIGLVDADNVTVSASGAVTFKDDEGTASTADDNGLADGLNPAAPDAGVAADIVAINGATVTNTVYYQGATPVNGAISFTIDGDAAGSVIPVIWVDANGNQALDLNAANQPTEDFGIGGVTTYTAPAAGVGATGGTVTSVDKDANTFSSGGFLYSYDSNDQYSINGQGGVDLATFEAALSSGDVVTVTNYAPNAGGVSSFALNNANPNTPTTAAAANAGVVNDDDSNDITVTVTGTTITSGNYDSVVVQRAAYSAATTSRTWATVATVAKGDDADKTTADGDFNYVDRNVAPGAYVYRTALINDGDQSDFSAESNDVTSTTPVNDTTAPTAVDTRVATNGGSAFQLDGTDSFTVAFSEKMAAPTNGDAIRVRDADGTIWEITATDTTTDTDTVPDNFTLNTGEVTIGGTTYAAGQVLTVKLGTTGADHVLAAGDVTGLDLPATITAQSGTTDVVGNQWNVSTGDVQIDSE